MLLVIMEQICLLVYISALHIDLGSSFRMWQSYWSLVGAPIWASPKWSVLEQRVAILI
jgi:hypothetical protein